MKNSEFEDLGKEIWTRLLQNMEKPLNPPDTEESSQFYKNEKLQQL